MGKKTIKVKYTEDATIVAFSQTEDDLLKIYPENAMNGIWGNVIVPLHGDDHFYYRKDIGNGEMLICGECYSCSTKELFNKELGSYEQEHRFSDIGFIEEDSLVDDDGDFDLDEWLALKRDEREANSWNETPVPGNTTADSPPPEQDTVVQNAPGFKTPELRAYVVYWDDLVGKTTPITDNEFITESELQGTVYSVKGFQAAFNDDAINSSTCSVRFLTT